MHVEGTSMRISVSKAVKHSEGIPSSLLRSKSRQSIKDKSKVRPPSCKHITVFGSQRIGGDPKGWIKCGVLINRIRMTSSSVGLHQFVLSISWVCKLCMKKL